MSWTPLDCHAHTTMSDGALTVAELVAQVRARGVRPGVADHLSRDLRSSVKSVEEVESYLDTLEQHEVARGGEFCWHDGLWRELPERLVRRFTHRIGSLHAIFLENGDVLHAFTGRLPDGMTPDAYMELHLANLERFAVEMPVDILAHPTLVPSELWQIPLEELWTEARETRAVEALYRAGIAFELSSRYRAHERLVRRAAARGVRLSLGSDGHSAEQVGDVSFPLARARALGVPDDALYDPFVHGSRSLDGRPARA